MKLQEILASHKAINIRDQSFSHKYHKTWSSLCRQMSNHPTVPQQRQCKLYIASHVRHDCFKPFFEYRWWRHEMETFSALLTLCAGNSPVTGKSPHSGQWRGALMFSLICVWKNGWVNNRNSGDLRRHRVHYDVTVMIGFEYVLTDKTPFFKTTNQLLSAPDPVTLIMIIIMHQ